MSGENFCANCGTQISPTARFCPSCGAPVESAPAKIPLVPPTQVIPQSETPAAYATEPVPAAFATEPPSYPYPPTGEPTKKRPAWLWGVGAGGCLLILLMGICLVMLIFRDTDGSKPKATETVVSAVEETIQAISAVDTPVAAPVDTPVALPLALTGNQEQTAERLFDDFSSKALGWSEGPLAEGWVGYQDGGFAIRVTQPDRGIISPVPLDSLPNHIDFTALVTSEKNAGIFGVRCLAQNKNDFFEVWLDSDTQSYRLMQFSDGNPTPLIEWKETDAMAFGSDPNSIVIECLPGMISLMVNNQSLFEQSVQAKNGKMYLMVKTYSDTTQPMEVLFDDVEAWKQMQ
jgi:hypothetical protein